MSEPCVDCGQDSYSPCNICQALICNDHIQFEIRVEGHLICRDEKACERRMDLLEAEGKITRVNYDDIRPDDDVLPFNDFLPFDEEDDE